MMKTFLLRISLWVFMLLSACAPAPTSSTGLSQSTPGGLPKVLAVENFMADIAQNVAGDRVKVDSLIPIGVDPHAFEPVPQDVVKIADSGLLIVNGAGLEESWLQKTLNNAGGNRLVVEAATGLASRTPRPGELVTPGAQGAATDPHFWLDPTQVITYTENIRDGLIQVDPAGKDVYTRNADNYITQLKTLDQWVADQVSQIPAGRRLLVTNHESLGYYADRYGFTIVGAIIPSTSPEASSSAQQIARLIDQIKATQAPAIFLEAGSNPQLADQIAQETGVKVVTDLYTHFLTGPGGSAPTYIDMIKYNTRIIAAALK
jgi:ABC-type Zn uptake system ZnuABC Zn-binding protein ZnuA